MLQQKRETSLLLCHSVVAASTHLRDGLWQSLGQLFPPATNGQIVRKFSTIYFQLIKTWCCWEFSRNRYQELVAHVPGSPSDSKPDCWSGNCVSASSPAANLKVKRTPCFHHFGVLWKKLHWLKRVWSNTLNRRKSSTMRMDVTTMLYNDECSSLQS